MAAAGGAVAGMALGYGIGRFPRPQFQFHNQEEEYYYNYYMYRKYGVRSTDTNDYSRDYKFTETTESFDKYMNTCIRRTDLLPEERTKAPITTTTTASKLAMISRTTPATSSNSTSSNKKGENPATNVSSTSQPLNSSETNPTTAAPNYSNKTAQKVETGNQTVTTTAPVPASMTVNHTSNTTAEKNLFPSPSTPNDSDKSKINPVPPTSQTLKNSDDDDEVSIVEIGYPALIKQMKIKRCIELYTVYAERNLKKAKEEEEKKKIASGVQGLEIGLGGLLSIVTCIILTLMNSNMQTILH